jgi:signal peptidase I
VHDASELVWMVDAVVVTCRTDITTTKDAEHTQELLGLLGSPPAGVVILTSEPQGEARSRPAVPASASAEPFAPVAPAPVPTPPAAETPPAPSTPEPVASGGPPAAYAPSSSSSVGILTRPVRPAALPQQAAEPDTVDWATRQETQEPGADSDSIRRQLALPARRVAGWAGTVALMVVMWFIIRAFLFQSFYIPSPSMTPALKPGDRVLVSKLSYRLHDVRRGDIVVFKRPPHVQAGPEVKDLVKRVIGLPGDTVEARDGQVIVNGKALNEPYIAQGAVTSAVPPTHIAPNHYWVMGDNRSVSEDSRYFGSISGSLVVGRVFLQVWPISHLGLI